VISSISTVENYEYGFFWYLYQDGTIQFEIKLTGILSLGAAKPGERPKYGVLVAPQLYAPNHQHFFNMRLDFDLDGAANSVYQVDVVPEDSGDINPFANGFYAKPTLLKTERQARAHLDVQTARTWKIVNPAVKNTVGEPVAYKFMPGDNSFPFAAPGAWWRKRAGFVNYHVWVTPYRDDEKYGAGDYPNQSGGGDGLVRWTEQDRKIENTDVVLWYTFSHTHIPRPEDYPVMPTAYIGFTLKPLGFFAMNPALDVPPSAKQTSTGGSCCH
jgi:primary-amine oxidase